LRSTLRGPRVVLRTLDERDAADLWRAVRDPELRRLTGTHRVFTEDGIAEWCRTRGDAPGRYDWAIEADTGWVGDCALTDIDEDNQLAGYRIALERRLGEGLGTEATDAVLAFAFGELGLHRVELEVFDFNERAQKSYAKSGFVVEGVRRGALLWDGERHDAIMMAALRNT
jgi:RimJ/RimL family protein N-acetyltransferase